MISLHFAPLHLTSFHQPQFMSHCRHFTPPPRYRHFSSPHYTSPHSTSPRDTTSRHLTSFDATSLHCTSWHFPSRRVTPFYLESLRLTSHRFIPPPLPHVFVASPSRLTPPSRTKYHVKSFLLDFLHRTSPHLVPVALGSARFSLSGRWTIT